MLYWMGIECWSVARTYCLGPPKLLVSAPELELKFPIPKHICRSLNCASLHSEVDSTNKNTLLTGVTNQKRILGYGGNSFIIHLNASALFTPWVISIYYESRVKLCSTGYFFFFSFLLVLLLGSWKGVQPLLFPHTCDNDNFSCIIIKVGVFLTSKKISSPHRTWRQWVEICSCTSWCTDHTMNCLFL